MDLASAMRTVKRLEAMNVDAVEISYGTMEYALNIMRGACPVDVILKVNPLFSGLPCFARRMLKGESAVSRCTNCNLCAAYCDSENRLRCYQRKEGATHANS